MVSSAHPDATLHGRGFVARLTGATAEFLSMWSLMMAGPQPFSVNDGELCLAFRPSLPVRLFRGVGALTFTFLGQLRGHVSQVPAPHRADARDRDHPAHGRWFYELSLPGGVIGAPYAALVRSGDIRRIELCLE